MSSPLALSLSERPSIVQGGINFRKFGYFTRPITVGDLEKLSPDEAGEWSQLEQVIEACKAGRFGEVGQLLPLFLKSRHWAIARTAARVLGHAGSAAHLQQLRSALDALSVREMARVEVATHDTFLEACRAFAAWGRLDVVPELLDLYLTLRFKGTYELQMLPIWMSKLLEDEHEPEVSQEPAEHELNEYFLRVLRRYEATVDRLGSDQKIVYRGHLRSAQDLAKRMKCRRLPTAQVELSGLREIFEPMTGVDCSEIFAAGDGAPAAADALAEQFLASSSASSFEPGVRTFFGHRVPE